MVNVGVARIGEYGSVDAIAQAKGELVEALAANGLAVLNAVDGAVTVAGLVGDSVQVPDQEVAVAFLGEYLTPGDVVLVKRSLYPVLREARQSEVVAS